MTADERPVGRPSEGALWASVAETVQQVVLPALGDDPHTRQVAIQLVGLATYAGPARAGPDARPDRRAGRSSSTPRPGPASPLVAGRWTEGSPRTPDDVLTAAGRRAGSRRGSRRPGRRSDDGGDAVRDDLRAALLRHLDEDLATEDVLLGAFRGRLPDG